MILQYTIFREFIPGFLHTSQDLVVRLLEVLSCESGDPLYPDIPGASVGRSLHRLSQVVYLPPEGLQFSRPHRILGRIMRLLHIPGDIPEFGQSPVDLSPEIRVSADESTVNVATITVNAEESHSSSSSILDQHLR